MEVLCQDVMHSTLKEPSN